MTLIPSSISSNSEATFGEKKIHTLFNQLYGDMDDVIVWYEPPPLVVRNNWGTQKRYTDFIIFSQIFGILNIEIKDWKKENIIKIDNEFWEIKTDDGKPTRKDNPFQQSRRCAYGIKDCLSKQPLLVHNNGKHVNKLKFPVGHGVIFTKMSRNDLKEIGFGSTLFGDNSFLCKDDINFEISDKHERLLFEKKLRDMFEIKFEFEPLGFLEFKALRSAIWPELIVTPIDKDKEKVELKDISLLDLEQENIAKSLGDGHYLLKGVAGSGKTLILAYRVRYFSQLHPDWKILFVCYNISLRKYVEAIINNLMPDGLSKVEILHFHELVKIKTNENIPLHNNESSEDYDLRVGTTLEYAILNNRIFGGKYDAIMIDEAQDFSTEWLRGVKGLINKNESLTISYDPAQEIYPRKRIWKDANIEVVGGRRSRRLKRSYRNTHQILQLAIKFMKYDEYIGKDSDDPDSPLAPEEVTKQGEKAVFKNFIDNGILISDLAKEIKDLLRSGKYQMKDIALLCTSRRLINQLYGALSNYGITLNIFPTPTERINLDINSNDIKAITCESSKGLEWNVVFILGAENMPRENRIAKYEKNILYLSLTRAREKLYMYYTEENNFIKELIAINDNIK